MVEQQRTSDEEDNQINGDKFVPLANLKPSSPQPPKYGPGGPGSFDPNFNQEEYDALHRPLVPSLDYQMEQMTKHYSELGERARIAALPENIIKRLEEDVRLLEEDISAHLLQIKEVEKKIKNENRQEKSQIDNRLITNLDLEITVLNGKIAQRKIVVNTIKTKIEIVKVTGALPANPYIHKSSFVTQKELKERMNKDRIKGLLEGE